MPRWFHRVAEYYLRIAIAVGFLSAVADRFGIWGAPGAPGVAWGDWNNFVQYVGKLNWFAPVWLHSPLGWVATIAEIVIAVGLLIGWKLHWFAFGAGILTLMFFITMTVALGIKAPLDYSVPAISAGAFYLAAIRWPAGATST